MSAERELIVPAEQVNEIIGLTSPVPRLVGPTLDVAVNLRRLNITDPGNPGFGEWVDRKAVLRWLEAHNRKGNSLDTMIVQFRELMES